MVNIPSLYEYRKRILDELQESEKWINMQLYDCDSLIITTDNKPFGIGPQLTVMIEKDMNKSYAFNTRYEMIALRGKLFNVNKLPIQSVLPDETIIDDAFKLFETIKTEIYTLYDAVSNKSKNITKNEMLNMFKLLTGVKFENINVFNESVFGLLYRAFSVAYDVQVYQNFLMNVVDDSNAIKDSDFIINEYYRKDNNESSFPHLDLYLVDKK